MTADWHDPTELWDCPYCDLVFEARSEWARHIDLDHGREVPDVDD